MSFNTNIKSIWQYIIDKPTHAIVFDTFYHMKLILVIDMFSIGNSLRNLIEIEL